MKRYFVYILECSDKSFYTGVTSNLEKRINEHQTGFSSDSYTYTRRPLKLVYNEEFQTIDYAIRAEKQIKGWSRKKKIALINRDIELLKKLSVCQNSSDSRNKV